MLILSWLFSKPPSAVSFFVLQMPRKSSYEKMLRVTFLRYNLCGVIVV